MFLTNTSLVGYEHYLDHIPKSLRTYITKLHVFSLPREFLKRIGVSPLFPTEYHPEGNAIAEPNIASLKKLIAKRAYVKQRSWVKYGVMFMGHQIVSQWYHSCTPSFTCNWFITSRPTNIS